jgi:predicted flap endonuclease-1-like 5' DNA nuclease
MATINVVDVEGGVRHSDALRAASIESTEELLTRAGAYQDRAALMTETGLDEWQLLQWLGRADLERVHGIGWEYASLLAEAGVLSMPILAAQDAETLHGRVEAINAETERVKRVPTVSQISQWIEEARTLPDMITYAPAGEVL